MDSPVVDNFANVQTYKALYRFGNNDVAGNLAPPTYAPNPAYPAVLNYVKGQLIALYTSGPNVGYYVSYDSTGTNGQNVCVGWIDDDRLPWIYPGINQIGSRALIRYGSRPYNMVMNNALVAKTTADIATGMAQLGAKLINDSPTGETYWYIP